jgi:DNA polymerase
MLFWAIGDDEPTAWFRGDPLPPFMENPLEYMWYAMNSLFEYGIFTQVLKWVVPGFKNWTDTAAIARYSGLPGRLATLSAALQLGEHAKDPKGKKLINLLSIPQKAPRATRKDPEPFYRKKRLEEGIYKFAVRYYRNPEMHLPNEEDASDKEQYDIDTVNFFLEFCRYCAKDVIAEREARKYCRDFNPTERAAWELDQKINMTGIPMDRESIQHAVNIFDKQTVPMLAELKGITQAEKPVSWQQFLKWLKEVKGENVPNCQAETLEELAKTTDDEELIRAIQLRTALARTPLKKYHSFLLKIVNGRIYGGLMYGGAHTLRWSSMGVNFQNINRPVYPNPELILDLFKDEDPGLVEAVYGDVLEALSSCLRAVVCAEPGHIFRVADFSAIEARVLAWLAGQEDVLEVFRTHGLIYEAQAQQVFTIADINDVTKNQRATGKTCTLAFGYGGGLNAYLNFADEEQSLWPDEKILGIRDAWRKSNHMIKQYWYDVGNAAVEATRHRGKRFKVRSIWFQCSGSFLHCKLPSGRLMSYHRPKLKPETFVYKGKKRTRDVLYYWGRDSQSGNWVEHSTWGGKLVENIAQAVARDLLEVGLRNADAAGYEIPLHVHDEIVAHCEEDFGSLGELCDLMCDAPEWAKGLPLSAAGYESKRYKKD